MMQKQTFFFLNINFMNTIDKETAGINLNYVRLETGSNAKKMSDVNLRSRSRYCSI